MVQKQALADVDKHTKRSKQSPQSVGRLTLVSSLSAMGIGGAGQREDNAMLMMIETLTVRDVPGEIKIVAAKVHPNHGASKCGMSVRNYGGREMLPVNIESKTVRERVRSEGRMLQLFNQWLGILSYPEMVMRPPSRGVTPSGTHLESKSVFWYANHLCAETGGYPLAGLHWGRCGGGESTML